MKRRKRYAVLAILSIYLFTSCDKEDEFKYHTSSDFKVEDIDKTFFEQIRKANDISAENKLWKGYDFNEFPMYFVFQDADKKPQRGYVVNPTGKVKGAIKLNKADSKGINVYRYDDAIQMVSKLIHGSKGNGAYDMDVGIAGGKYYCQVYDQEGIEDEANHPIILAFHEVFHQFQFSWSQGDGLQDEKNYPLTKELLPLQMLTVEIAKKISTVKDKNEIKKYLAMYVAIRSKEMELDPSKDKLVANMANWQEHGEGTAKYVEYMLGQYLFKDYPKVFETIKLSNVKSKEEMRMFFAWGIWYGTGASVIYMLKQLGVDVESLVKDGKTIYTISEEFLKLTQQQKESYLNQAKDELDWKGLERETKRLLDL